MPTHGGENGAVKPTLGLALDIAARYHAGQSDEAGEPCIGHIVRVVRNVRSAGGSVEAQMVAALHDLLEQTGASVDELVNLRFPASVVTGVVALTRQDGESYHDCLLRAALHTLAREVKLADLSDREEESRMNHLDSVTAARLRRQYANARWLIAQFQV